MLYYTNLLALLVLFAVIFSIIVIKLIKQQISDIAIKPVIRVKLESEVPEKLIFDSDVDLQINRAKKNAAGICYKRHKHMDCQCGNMNIGDPFTMNDVERKLFKYNYPQNMTLQDYVNWLWLYNKSSNQFHSDIHKANLDKLKKGGFVTEIPHTPINSSNFFEKIYKKELDNSPVFESDGKLKTADFYQGYNIGDFAGMYEKI